jgi:hypothetical protein
MSKTVAETMVVGFSEVEDEKISVSGSLEGLLKIEFEVSEVCGFLERRMKKIQFQEVWKVC